MTGVVELLGGGGAIVAAIWLWRLQTITRLIKFLSVGALMLGALSILGVLSIAINWSAAWAVGEALWGLVWRLWAALS